MKGLINLLDEIFQLDNKDYITRISIAMISLSLLWGILGIIDALMVRLQELSWGMSQTLILTPQEYYAGIGLHAMRDFFGFAVQLEFAVFIYLSYKLLNFKPRAKWLLNIGFILFNISFMLLEGPIIVYPKFNDNYFSADSWYYLSPYGLPNFSQYIISPLWYFGWELMDIGVYIYVIWLVYHYYLATQTIKGKLPIFGVYVLMTSLMTAIGWSGETAANTWDIFAYYGLIGLDPIANQIAFGILWHSIVYITWMPAVATLYLLIPMLANKPLYSDRMGRISALLYLIFSNNVPIHHLYMVNLSVAIKSLEEVLTYTVVVPSMMTFFNLWVTVKGASFHLNLISAWVIVSFAGAIAAGVTGIANGTVVFDAMIHDTLWVVGHFHAMIFWSIVPAGFATLYYMIPMMIGKNWYSNKLGWMHFVGYLIGTTMIIIGFDALGVTGLIRKPEIYPLISDYVTPEILASIGAIIADLATLLWLINLLLTFIKGKNINVQSINQAISIIAATTTVLEWDSISQKLR